MAVEIVGVLVFTGILRLIWVSLILIPKRNKTSDFDQMLQKIASPKMEHSSWKQTWFSACVFRRILQETIPGRCQLAVQNYEHNKERDKCFRTRSLDSLMISGPCWTNVGFCCTLSGVCLKTPWWLDTSCGSRDVFCICPWACNGTGVQNSPVYYGRMESEKDPFRWKDKVNMAKFPMKCKSQVHKGNTFWSSSGSLFWWHVRLGQCLPNKGRVFLRH